MIAFEVQRSCREEPMELLLNNCLRVRRADSRRNPMLMTKLFDELFAQAVSRRFT
jgi:hypothetical protein